MDKLGGSVYEKYVLRRLKDTVEYLIIKLR